MADLGGFYISTSLSLRDSSPFRKGGGVANGEVKIQSPKGAKKMKKTNKILSIILAILMIATTVPFAFAADEIPDFSDAKVLTSDEDGFLYSDGIKIDVSETQQTMPGGKYKLEGNITTGACFIYTSQEDVMIDLNGYVWDMKDKFITARGMFSIYDTSEDETGKLTTSVGRIFWIGDGSVFNLYSGTIESTSSSSIVAAVHSSGGDLNFYSGKLVSNAYAIGYYGSDGITVKIYDTVLECGDGYSEINGLYLHYTEVQSVVYVSDYTGDSLTIDFDVNYSGVYKAIKGIKNAEEAEKYHINFISDAEVTNEKIEYDEATGDISIYVADNTFTQQPSAENNYTVDFNNPNTSFQWYEVEENYIGKYIAEEYTPLFSYDFKAGDTLKVSTDSELKFVHLRVGDSRLTLRNEKTATVKIDTDGTMIIESMYANAENPVELEFSVIKETELEGETGKTLHKFECGKSYYCKATVGNYVYVSDTVTIAGRHVITQVDAKAPTCTEIGWDAYEYCTACYYTTYNEIPATNHKDTLVEVEAKANTCTEIGWDAYEYCTVCDYTTYVEKAALDHDIVIDAYVAPQCTETGLTAGQHCSRCDDMTIAQEVIPDLGGHINEDGNTTCDRCGETLLCEDCGRPVHKEEGIPKYICWLITLIKMIVSFFK